VQASSGWSRTRHGFSKKMGTQDLLEQTIRQALHTSCLMTEERFQLPLLTLHLLRARNSIEIKPNWHLKNTVILSATKLGASALRAILSITLQVTTGCDLVPIFKGTFAISRFVDGRRLLLMLQSYEGRGSEEPQSRTRCPSSDGRLRSPRRCCGPRPECPWHLATRGWEEAGPRSLELRGARR
jgi:hypothetical protein